MVRNSQGSPALTLPFGEQRRRKMEAKCCYTCKWSDVAKNGYADYVLVCLFDWMNKVVLNPEEAKSCCKCEIDNDLKSRGYKWDKGG
jgi:hypothetical protein